MSRGPGIRAKLCHCKLPSCGRIFKSCREDARTCSVSCRKALNRLLGGSVRKPKAVTAKPNGNGPCRVYLNGRWIASYESRDRAELAVAGWLEEWDGTFEIKAVAKSRAAKL